MTTTQLPILGLTIRSVDVDRCDDAITFTTDAGRKFVMQHHQDCCESVTIDDICGDLADLVESPITQAEETVNEDEDPDATWTFYRIGTAKGMVTIRWYGSSNGYYSERVDFDEITPESER